MILKYIKFMSRTIKFRKGIDIRIKGGAEQLLEQAPESEVIALKPTDFPGLTPRLAVKPGDELKAGEPLFSDKYNPEVIFVSPVGGTVKSVIRGERRKILEVLIEADDSRGSVDFGKADPLLLDGSGVKERLLKAGMWPFLKRRPYGTIARTNEVPKSIFVSCFDTAPFAPDYNFILKKEVAAFQTGINALAKLTSGKVHVGLPAVENHIFGQLNNAEISYYSGPHPAGNVGIQIHHTDPVCKGEVVWTINPQDLLFIGRLFETGITDFSKIIALTGSEVTQPRYLKTMLGTRISEILEGNLNSGKKLRVISGNPLTGTHVSNDNYLCFYDSQITVIPEGDEYDFLGWAKPRLNKFSMSHAYFSWLMPGKSYAPDANLNGEKRAYVMTGQYEKVLPMDILPVQLIKSILAEDIDKMEKLGIYEVIEEDLALCEFVCTSKIEVQHILKRGINLMMKELG
jgi:Na+-transporting NADH:ubiquinone oxidoreductase subunit A